jgi:hypothetical protein
MIPVSSVPNSELPEEEGANQEQTIDLSPWERNLANGGVRVKIVARL